MRLVVCGLVFGLALSFALTRVLTSSIFAKELLFGRIPVEFPVSVAVVDSYDNAK